MNKPPRETDDEERRRIQNERWNLPEIVQYRKHVLDTIVKGWEAHPSPALFETDHRRVLAMMRADMNSRAELVRHEALAQGKSMCGIKTIIWLVGNELWRAVVDGNGLLPMEQPKNTQPYDVRYRQMYLRAESDDLELKNLEKGFEGMKASTAKEISGPLTMTPRQELAEGKTTKSSETEVVKTQHTFSNSPEDLAMEWHRMLGKEQRIPWGGPFTIAVPREMLDGPAGMIKQPQHLNQAVKLFAQERPMEDDRDFWIVGISFADAIVTDNLDDIYRDIMIAYDGLLVWGIRHVVWGVTGGVETLCTSVEERCKKLQDSYDQDRMASLVSEHLAHLTRSMRDKFGP